ncbi:unnamed protein product [Closterium sp. NIES-54]
MSVEGKPGKRVDADVYVHTSVASPSWPSRRPAACAPHCWQPHHPALPARYPALPALSHPAARTALLRAALLLPALLLAALLANALLPARRPAGSRTAARIALPAPPCYGVSLFDHTSGAALAPLATADSATRSQWLTRDAAARLAVRNHLPLAKHAHFGQHKTAKALYGAVVTRYSSLATAALGRLILPYLFPELSAFATLEDLITHLRPNDTRYRTALPVEFLDKNPPPMYTTLYFIVTRLPDSLCAVRDHFLALDPTDLTVDLLEKHLLEAETSVVTVGATRGTPRRPFFEGCSPFPLAPSFVSAATVDILAARARVARVVAVAVWVVVVEAVEAVEVAEVVAAVGVVAGVGASVVAVAAPVGVGVVVVAATRVVAAAMVAVGVKLVGRLGVVFAARMSFAQDAILAAMYALSVIAKGDCYLCVPPDLGIEAATLGASESALPGTAPAEALHTFTLDSGASLDFFRDITTLTPLPAPVPVRLADPSGAQFLAVPPLFSRVRRSLPPPSPSPAPPYLPCVEGRQRAPPHSSSFPPTTAPLQTHHMDVWGPARVSGQGRERYFLLDLPVLRLHSDRGGEFSSDILRDFCRGEGILHSFMLPASLQQNGVSERRIGLVMEVARTSMIHAAAPHFLWPFATSPTLRWTGKVGDASVFCVWGSRAFVRDTSADKLSSRAIPCVFLGFPADATGWQFYHPTSRRVLPSQGVTFDESVPFYRPSQVDPLPPQGPAHSGVSQVDPLSLAEPVEVPVDSSATRDDASGGAASRGAMPGEFGGTEPEGAEPGGAESEGAESGGAEPRGIASAGGPAGSSPRLGHR